MSMFASIISTIKAAKVKYNLTEEDAVELFMDIMGDIVWEYDNVDYNVSTWEEQEKLEAKRLLFGT